MCFDYITKLKFFKEKRLIKKKSKPNGLLFYLLFSISPNDFII